MVRIARIGVAIATLLVGCAALVLAQNDSSALTSAELQWIRSIPSSDGPIVNTSGTFETRFGEAPFASIQAIYTHPRIVANAVSYDGHGGITSIADAQAVFPGTPEQFVKAISAITHYDLLSYRTVYSVDKNPENAVLQYHLQVQAVSAGVLGIAATYIFATNNYGEQLPNGAYGFKWNLERSYKNAFTEVRGSWYLRPVTYEGRECTYVRYFNHSDASDSPPIPLFILQGVFANDYRQLLTAVYQHRPSH